MMKFGNMFYCPMIDMIDFLVLQVVARHQNLMQGLRWLQLPGFWCLPDTSRLCGASLHFEGRRSPRIENPEQMSQSLALSLALDMKGLYFFCHPLVDGPPISLEDLSKRPARVGWELIYSRLPDADLLWRPQQPSRESLGKFILFFAPAFLNFGKHLLVKPVVG